MDVISNKLFIYLNFIFSIIYLVNSHTYTVKIGTDNYVNVVDSKFLSFTVDPKYLFSTNDIYNSKECICMASALTPAYIRISGSSTAHMHLRNTTITLHPEKQRPLSLALESKEPPLSVSYQQWRKFAEWAQNTGFQLVFSLNNDERMDSGIWDPNSALSILTVAERSKVEDVVWQLGYECKNQTIEEYLNDLDTLRVIVETIQQHQDLRWKVVGGDVTPCLEAESKSDFKDYVTLSDQMMDAIFLDGNSTSHQLEQMSLTDRHKLLGVLSNSDTPLWLSEQSRVDESETELQRAFHWMYSLGHSAKNGFSVHFRESREDELMKPTTSFYMALLFKNLVGDKVLNVDFEAPSEQAFLFAHCTSLRHKSVPGAVTLYGANMDDEPARFSLKLSKREEGGDIMQFVLGTDVNGNIIVNGKPMYYEGDIKPIVKRVRPYKTLLINLPPKSFGFWVLANTKTDACQEEKPNKEKKFLDTVGQRSEEKYEENNVLSRKRRSVKDNEPDSIELLEVTDLRDSSFERKADVKTGIAVDALLERIENLNKDLKNVHEILNEKLSRHERVTDFENLDRLKREKRQIKDITDGNANNKKPNTSKKPLIVGKARSDIKTPKDLRFTTAKPKSALLGQIMQLKERLNNTRTVLRQERERRISELNKKKPKVSKRNSKDEVTEKVIAKNNNDLTENNRRKRSIIITKKNKLFNKDDRISENEIQQDDTGLRKFGKIIHKINDQLQNIGSEGSEVFEDDKLNESVEEKIILSTRISGDDASITLGEKSSHGMFKTTFAKIKSIFDDLGQKLNNIMNALPLLD